MSTEPADILRDALLLLRREGWAKYGWLTPRGYCVEGAIDHVVAGQHRLIGLPLIEAEAGCWPFVYRAIDSLFPDRLGRADTIPTFNTHAATTFGDVEQMLEKAIAMAEEDVCEGPLPSAD